MHMHACMHDLRMRTTIEIDDEKLIKLKKLAAERGERGFSKLVDEALAAFLGDAEQQRRRRLANAICAAAGSITDETAEEMIRFARESRRTWHEQ